MNFSLSSSSTASERRYRRVTQIHTYHWPTLWYWYYEYSINVFKMVDCTLTNYTTCLITHCQQIRLSKFASLPFVPLSPSSSFLPSPPLLLFLYTLCIWFVSTMYKEFYSLLEIHIMTRAQYLPLKKSYAI